MFRQVLRQGARAAKRAGQVCKEAARPSSGASYVAAAKVSTHAGARKGSSVAATALSVAATIALSPVALAANDERTYIMIKPDGVHRGLIADIIERFERKGYKLVACKVLVPSKDLAGQHYAEHDGKPFYPKLVDFLSSGAVVAMVWEGKDVIKYGRSMIGATNPLASAPGTIRGDYGIDVGRNIIHGSDSVESAQREISLWFKADELAEYQLVATKWVYE